MTGAGYTGNWSWTIKNDNGGSPGSTTIATSSSGTSDASFGWKYADVLVSKTLQNNTKYWLAISGSNYWGYVNDNFSYGEMYGDSSKDFLFRLVTTGGSSSYVYDTSTFITNAYNTGLETPVLGTFEVESISNGGTIQYLIA
jgi:hypothetical protein